MRSLAFRNRRRVARQAARAAAKAGTPSPAGDTSPAPGDYRGGRRSPTPPVRRRASIREAPEVHRYHPERPAEEAAGGRSASPARRGEAAAPEAAKGPAKAAGKGKKGGGGKKGRKGGKGGKDRKGK